MKLCRLGVPIGFLAAALAAGCASSHPPSAGPTDAEASAGSPSGDAQLEPPNLEIRDATLGPGDTVTVNVHRHPDLTTSLTVPDSGVIFIPLAGELNVKGESGAMLRRTIAERLDRYLVDPQVSLNVGVQRSRKVMILGEVTNPGVYLIEEPTTALEIVAKAGGFTEEGTKRRIILVREKDGAPTTQVLNLRHVLYGKDLSDNVLVQRGDILYVPKSTLATIDLAAAHISAWLSPITRAETAILLGYGVNDRVSQPSVFVGN